MYIWRRQLAHRRLVCCWRRLRNGHLAHWSAVYIGCPYLIHGGCKRSRITRHLMGCNTWDNRCVWAHRRDAANRRGVGQRRGSMGRCPLWRHAAVALKIWRGRVEIRLSWGWHILLLLHWRHRPNSWLARWHILLLTRGHVLLLAWWHVLLLRWQCSGSCCCQCSRAFPLLANDTKYDYSTDDKEYNDADHDPGDPGYALFHG